MVNVQAIDGSEADGSSSPLQLSSSNVRGFLELSPDALILINQVGLIVTVNQQAEALFGYSCAQLLDQPLEQLLSERFRDGHREYLVRYFSTPRSHLFGARLSLFGLRQDGTEFQLDISLKPLLLDEGLVAIAAVRDMSAQRHLEEELSGHHAAEEHLATMNKILSATAEFVYQIDPHGRYLFASESAAELLGITQADFIGKTWQELGFPAEFADCALRRVDRVCTRGGRLPDQTF